MAKSIEEVIGQIIARGIEPPEAGLLQVDGRKITWAGDPRRPKRKNAFALLKEWRSPTSGKSYIVGVFGIKDEWWRVEPSQSEWTPAERSAWLEQKRALEKAEQQNRADAAALARDKADKIWARAKDQGHSAYLERKQIGAYGVRFFMGKLIVPLRDVDGALHGLQWIGADGSKTYGTGTVKEGHFHLLGTPKEGMPVAFGEGYATCASGHQATGWPVVACFDAGNIATVMAQWRKLYPDTPFVIFADDDRHLVTRLCERLATRHRVPVTPADFARSAGGLRDMVWTRDDGSVVSLHAKWAKDKAGVYYIEGHITDGGMQRPFRLENAGRAKAFAAAKRYNARVVLPKFADRTNTGTDFNDLHLSEGLEVVRTQLLAPPTAPGKDVHPQSPAGASPAGSDGRGLVFPFVDDKFRPRGIRENVYFALQNDPRLRDLVRYNDFAQTIDRQRPAPWATKLDTPTGEWETLDDLRLAAYMASAHGVIVGNAEAVGQAVLMAAADARYNPLKEWLQNLVWDGTERLPYWLIDCVGAEDTEYIRKVSTYFLISMAARAFEPGCQMDYMLVLQGDQGRGKSSLMQVLAGEWFGAGSFRVGEKDSLLALQGRWMFNFGELDALNKTEDTAIKQFITERTDNVRPPYGKHVEKFPRTCVLTGDTNKTEFLKDPTGARRFWVVACGDVNLDAMRGMREQLLAEAVHRWRAGERRWPDRDEYERLFKPEEERWRQDDIWVQPLLRYVNSNVKVERPWPGAQNRDGIVIPNIDRQFFSTEELLTQALHVDIGKADGAGIAAKRIGDALKSPVMGFKAHRWGKYRVRGYIRDLKAPTGRDSGASGPAGSGAA